MKMCKVDVAQQAIMVGLFRGEKKEMSLHSFIV